MGVVAKYNNDASRLTDLFGSTLVNPTFPEHAEYLAAILKRFRGDIRKGKFETHKFTSQSNKRCPEKCTISNKPPTPGKNTCPQNLCNGTGLVQHSEDVKYNVGIDRLKLFLTKAVLQNTTRRVSAYVDDKIIFWVTKIEKDNTGKEIPVGTSLIELILLPDGIASVKKLQHKIYDITRVSPCLAEIISRAANEHDQMKQTKAEEERRMRSESLQKVSTPATPASLSAALSKAKLKRLITRKRETNPQLSPSIIQAQKEYAFEPIVLSPMELSPTEELPTEESPKEAQERRKNRPWLNKLRYTLRESKHKSPPSVSPPMTPRSRRLSPAPGSRKCDSPVLVRLLEEIEDAKRRS